ncbi:MAG: signal peptidase II [Candidatus Binataceae bacterium]
MSVAAHSAGASVAVRRPYLVLLAIVTAPIIVLDQATKLLVGAQMELGESIPIITNYLDLTYTQNPGAAFSMFANLSSQYRLAFLIALSTGAIVVLLWLLVQNERVSLTSFALALVLAGASGNLIDRARLGRVIDFVRVHYREDWSYPIFNVADSAISVGVALIILGTLMQRGDRT